MVRAYRKVILLVAAAWFVFLTASLFAGAADPYKKGGAKWPPAPPAPANPQAPRSDETPTQSGGEAMGTDEGPPEPGDEGPPTADEPPSIGPDGPDPRTKGGLPYGPPGLWPPVGPTGAEGDFQASLGNDPELAALALAIGPDNKDEVRRIAAFVKNEGLSSSPDLAGLRSRLDGKFNSAGVTSYMNAIQSINHGAPLAQANETVGAFCEQGGPQ